MPVATPDDRRYPARPVPGVGALIIDRGSTKANLSLKEFGSEQLIHF